MAGCRNIKGVAGFTLPAVLVVSAALLIIALGAMLVVGVERGTSRSFVDRQRAELAARAGMEHVRGMLHAEASNDDFLIVQSTLTKPTMAGRDLAPYLFLVRAKAAMAGAGSCRLIPLFSTSAIPQTKSTIDPPSVDSLVGNHTNDQIEFIALPYQDKVCATWLPVCNESGQMVARYAFWVEDLQSKIDPAMAGNLNGKPQAHVRSPWPHPAPGLKDLSDHEALPLDQIALYAVDSTLTEDQQGTAAESLIKHRAMLISPESSLAAAGLSAPLAREASGHLVNPTARAIEESLVAGLKPYEERPLIPFGEGLNPMMVGQPKLNLNRLVATGGDAAVKEMASFIRQSLPQFENRKGGFPDQYLETLAANAIDYADCDHDSTGSPGAYRGLDAYPLVSEFLMRFRWEKVIEENARKYIILSATTYIELWNMSDQPTSGSAEVTFETNYEFPLGANPSVSLGDMTNASPILLEDDGRRWFPAFNVTLKPDEYRVYQCGMVTYKIDAGPSMIYIPSPLVLEGETFGVSKCGYHLKWNGQLVDQSRGGIHRNNSSLNYPLDTASKPSQRIRATIPSHSHTRNGLYRNNMGDCRMSFYNLAPQDANAYPDNYSPNRRNVRWGTIYNQDAPTKPKVHGRVMPSEWPDGGHNSAFDPNGFFTTNERINPDDPRFFPNDASILRNPPVGEAPMRISNRGWFWSATELGRIYDPIMWETAMPTAANLPWGDVMPSSAASTDFGGGNTLRIGRPEHQKFNLSSQPGQQAWRLLDLFHSGVGWSPNPAEHVGEVTKIIGHVNLNTASRDVLRALVMGALVMDPRMEIRTSEVHENEFSMAPPVTAYQLNPSEIHAEANRIADAIINARKVTPFASPAAMAGITDRDGNLVFGNDDLLPNHNGPLVQRSDSAAEELFARVYESTTVRSRNVRVWVVGQSLSPTSNLNSNPEILAECRRVFTLFANPGIRADDGAIVPSHFKVMVLYENDF